MTEDGIAHIVSIGEKTIVARASKDCTATALALALGMSFPSKDQTCFERTITPT